MLPSPHSQVYAGYVDDPRNTDNAWMETVAYNFHDDTGPNFSPVKAHSNLSFLSQAKDLEGSSWRLEMMQVTWRG